MAKSNSPIEDFTPYRRLAEAQVGEAGNDIVIGLAPEQISQKIHELRVRLIEQELQNGELKAYCRQLQQAQAGLEDRLQKLLQTRDISASYHPASGADGVAPMAAPDPALAHGADFFTRMGHQLRSPLNAILGFSQLLDLEKESLTSSQLEYVESIGDAGKLLLSMINSIVDLAKLDAGQVRFKPQPVVLQDAITIAVSQWAALARKFDIDIQLPPADALSLSIDEFRMVQILSQLVSNAIRFNRPAGRVRIQVEKTPAQTARISIADDGPGIALVDQTRVFQPFVQMNPPIDNSRGAGVGLYLTRKLVTAMHGRIGFDSKFDRGTTFWVEFPLTEPVPRPAVPTAAPAETAAAGNVGHFRLIYIEDNAANRRLVERMLRKLPDCQLTLMENANQGLAEIRARKPDLILLDIELPDMDGYSVLRTLREDPATAAIPVIALSAHAMQEELAQAKRAGFDDYITKPIDLATLLAVVQRTLPRH